MGILTALDAVAEAPRIIDAMRLADDLAFEAGRDPGVRTLRVLAAAIAGDDDVTAIAGVHALAEVYDEQAALTLSKLLSDARPAIREHAAWALGQGLPRFDAVGRLTSQVAAGGFSGMLAQRTLEQWTRSVGQTIAATIEGALIGVTDPFARARLVETLGLVKHTQATRRLIELALNTSEHEEVRVAAVAALGQRRGTEGLTEHLESLAGTDDRLGVVARLAVVDLTAMPASRVVREHGLTIAQLFLHADIDPTLSAAGAGDNGGIATLLVRLGDALVADPGGDVQRVITLSRGPVSEATVDLLEIGGIESGHVYGRVPLRPESVPSAAAWPLRVTARRGIRRILRAAGQVDVLHLRMADVGSLAAADVARELGIPVVFTVAPDPHAVIQSMDLSGALTRTGFGEVDQREHFWFRTRLVQQLAGSAAHTVLFPRPELARDMRGLVGIEIDSHPERHTIVAEGVDLEVIDRSVEAAALSIADDAGDAGVPEDRERMAPLLAMLEQLPPERRGLPLVVSVGRLHRVKGMASLVQAWVGGPLKDRANLLIIGGDLAHPSLDEREQLDLIDAVVPADARMQHGLLLAGHRPNDVAARWLAAVRLGIEGLVAPDGVYVCASVKEEFGIALLEAMATGLTVVAPNGGGPATYVADGDTGVLAATWDVAHLGDAVGAALDLAANDDGGAVGNTRADRARAMVEERFTIQAMAKALSPVYRGVAQDEAELIRAAGALA